jgi:hypothetical protein
MSRTALSKSVLAIVLFALCSIVALAQSAPKTPKYDKATETTVKGVVDELKNVPGNDEGTHFILKDGEKSILIHVGPEKFLKEVEASYAKGDKVEVKGSKVKSAEGEDEILAKEITKDNNTVTLRDSKGEPAWHGWKL